MTNETIQNSLDALRQNRLTPIEAIPDLDLYMDQLITFFENHLGNTRRTPEDKLLTKTMINNYTKSKLLPPAKKKKYTLDHILLMLLIYKLKQVTSMEDIATLFKQMDSTDSDALHQAYQAYYDSQESTFTFFTEDVKRLSEIAEGNDVELLLMLFEQSLNYKRLAEKLLDQLSDSL